MACDCTEERWGEMCIEGTIYGYCTSDQCGGACDPVGSCPCLCHKSQGELDSIWSAEVERARQ